MRKFSTAKKNGDQTREGMSNISIISVSERPWYETAIALNTCKIVPTFRFYHLIAKMTSDIKL